MYGTFMVDYITNKDHIDITSVDVYLNQSLVSTGDAFGDPYLPRHFVPHRQITLSIVFHFSSLYFSPVL